MFGAAGVAGNVRLGQEHLGFASGAGHGPGFEQVYRGGGGFQGLELALIGEFLVGAPRALSGADRVAGAVPHLSCQPAGCAAFDDGRAELVEQRPE